MNLYTCSFASKNFSKQQDLQYSQLLNIGFRDLEILQFSEKDLDQDFFNSIPWATEKNRKAKKTGAGRKYTTFFRGWGSTISYRS